MPARTAIPLASAQNEASSGAVSIESLTNVYAEPAPPRSKSPFHLRHTPGLKKKVTVGTGKIRGIIPFQGNLFVVSGTNLYSVDANYNATLLTGVTGVYASASSIIPGSRNVFMATNGIDVAICSETITLIANATSFTTLSFFDFNGADYQDGYGIFTERDTQNVRITGLDDMTTMSALDFTTADAESDDVVGVLVNNEEVIVFKERTLEQYFNAGNADFPYVRSQNGVVERGCAASASIAQADRSALWLGDNLRVYLMQGLQPVPVSTADIERKIESATNIQDASAFTYQQEGQLFYQLSFDDLTVVYSLTTGLWHLRRSKGLTRSRANNYAYWRNRHVVGDYSNGNLYELDMSTYTENSEAVVRQAVPPPLYANGNPVFQGDLLLDIQGGAGLTTGQGDDPEIMLEVSDDLGNTWSAYRPAKAGPEGEYERQAVWNRLGRFRHTRHVRFSISDPVEVHWVGAAASLEAGA